MSQKEVTLVYIEGVKLLPSDKVNTTVQVPIADGKGGLICEIPGIGKRVNVTVEVLEE